MCAEKGEDADANDGEGRMHRRHDEPRRPVSYIHKLPIVRPWRLLLVHRRAFYAAVLPHLPRAAPFVRIVQRDSKRVSRGWSGMKRRSTSSTFARKLCTCVSARGRPSTYTTSPHPRALALTAYALTVHPHESRSAPLKLHKEGGPKFSVVSSGISRHGTTAPGVSILSPPTVSLSSSTGVNVGVTMSHLVNLVVVGMRVGGALGAVMTTQACKRIASSLRMHQDGGTVEGMGAHLVWCAENLGCPRDSAAVKSRSFFRTVHPPSRFPVPPR